MEPRAQSAVERELARQLERLTELEAATAEVSEALQRFRDERRARLGPAEDALHAARRFAERLTRLRAEAAQWAAGPKELDPVRRRRAPHRAYPPLPPSVAPPGEPAPWLSSKDLYRALVRALHPDLAKNDRERARRSELMARVNAAYAREDRVLLELLHDEAGRGVASAEPTAEIRASHAERRLRTIAPMVESLERGLARRRASSAFRELEAAREKSGRGGDFFAESRGALLRQATATLKAAFSDASGLDELVKTLRGRPGARPAAEHLLRRAAAPAEQRRPDDEARKLAADLGRAAGREMWQVVLSLFALFGEASEEAPPGLATLEVARERYEYLTTDAKGAPSFESVLLHPPPFLELGLRAYSRRLAFGLQLRRPELLAGVRAALRAPEVAELARRVLSAMGPRERCDACKRSVFLVHLFRVRGMGDVQALACPRCASVHRSYRSFGAPEGLEALSGYASALGLVLQQPMRVGTTDFTLGFLPGEGRRLTARAIVERLAELHPDVLSDELLPHVRLRASRRLLAASAVVPRTVRLHVTLADDAPLGVKELERELRARRAFNPSSRER